MNRYIVLAGLLVLTAIIVAVTFFQRGPENRDQAAINDASPIRVAAQNNGALFWVALDLGYFDDAGLKIVHKKYPTGRDAANALTRGEADMAMATDFILAKKILAGEDLAIISSVHSSEAIFLVASKKKGIATTADLRGKRIGVSVGTNADFFLSNFLVANGLSSDMIEIVDLNPSQLVDQFEENNLDAIFTWDPIVSRMKAKLAEDAFVVAGQGNQYFYFLLHSKRGWLKQNAARVEKFVNALVRAAAHVQAKPEDAKTRAIRTSGADAKAYRAAWSQHKHQASLPQELFLVIEEQARWLLRNKTTPATRMPNFLDYIYFDALAATDPDLITMVR